MDCHRQMSWEIIKNRESTCCLRWPEDVFANSFFFFFFAHTEPGTLSFRGTKQKLWPAPHLLSNVALWPTFASLKKATILSLSNILPFVLCQTYVSLSLNSQMSMALENPAGWASLHLPEAKWISSSWEAQCHWAFTSWGSPWCVVMAFAAHNKGPGLKPHCK